MYPRTPAGRSILPDARRGAPATGEAFKAAADHRRDGCRGGGGHRKISEDARAGGVAELVSRDGARQYTDTRSTKTLQNPTGDQHFNAGRDSTYGGTDDEYHKTTGEHTVAAQAIGRWTVPELHNAEGQHERGERELRHRGRGAEVYSDQG
jgi:hypothetical protein